MNETLRRNHLRVLLAALWIALSTPVAAAPPPPTPISPACVGTEYRQFDFWIGDWDTFETEAPDGPSIARAQVKHIAEGCAIHELYEQSDGLIGDSILSYDPVRKQLQQTWVTNRGAIMVLWGNVKDGAIVLEGETHQRDGSTVMQRVTWSVQDAGVRESAVLSKDDGKTWKPAFDVLFRKRKAEQQIDIAQRQSEKFSRPHPSVVQ